MGPLKGFRIVEFAGIGPGPMCAMLLADMGATVLRLERPTVPGLGIERPENFNLLNRGRSSVILDLKRPDCVALALDLIKEADAIIEGFRPGVMEKLGLGPEPCLAANPRLVYGRMTGWGQEGPLALAAGHDLNYIALTGALHAIGRAGQPPTPPLNLVGDYGGGALYLAFGIVCALLEAQKSGRGQVVDAAMIDGAASLMTPFYGLFAAGLHDGQRGENFLDSGAPYYDVYLCADGRYLSVAPIEMKFRDEFYRLIDLDTTSLPSASRRSAWPAIKEKIAERLLMKTVDEWCAILEGTDACVAPVLSMAEAPDHPHHKARGSFVEIGGVVQPAPAPRFSRTKPGVPTAPRPAGEGSDEALKEWGISADRVAQLRAAGTIGGSQRSA
jgi:alpha-methylacyl-CoA racemase